jgi:hypothetical protein
MNKPHIHADAIKAWADGAEIEFKANNFWLLTRYPNWYEDYEYRIKREPKPDVVKELCLICPKGNLSFAAFCDPNLKLTFDGETGKLKAAEVLI